ncbi:hypothetical protein [Methylobacterium sp. J-077]|uniref:hypothetical protein n=1 Tax=Methylobacterium sp. J-077 TaxID=2836656 RepID=UPI001FBAAC87|nr:hypothetical protein [Methylobacterium sp. J-077]MCJ2126651.1 hypothetical protein [Methylobacterium sp. J-077]
MARITFDQLTLLYRHIAFDQNGDQGRLSIATPEVLEVIQLIEDDQGVAVDADIVVLDDDALQVGQIVSVRVGPPRIALGSLVRDFDGLLDTPEARIKEPRAYFVIDGGITPDIDPCPERLATYRKVLEFTKLIGEAAAYVDQSKRELIFIKDGKFSVPLAYKALDLGRVSVSDADAILSACADEIHRDQKLAILAEAVIGICAAQPVAVRFRHLIANLGSVNEEVRNGYQLFASSFSYSKIRNEIEAARIDYLNKIHKTIIDIQTQLLGIPVATVIVASQLKVTSVCSVEFWTNFAVVVGAWIFVALLAIAIGNQWATLASISDDIARQKTKFQRDFAALSDQFDTIFVTLAGRIKWQRRFLGFVGMLAVVGAAVATFVAYRVTNVPYMSCWSGEVSASAPTPIPPAVTPVAPAPTPPSPVSPANTPTNASPSKPSPLPDPAPPTPAKPKMAPPPQAHPQP